MKYLTTYEIKKSLVSINQEEEFKRWFKLVRPILENEEFQKRRLFKHHEHSVWEHCVLVSFRAYKLSLFFHADSQKCSIGGLLHDFYPLAWQYSKELEEFDATYLERLSREEKLLKKHGFTHAHEACLNYLQFFGEYEDDVIIDCIDKHMFPLNLGIPKYLESWIVTISDKIETIRELPNIRNISIYFGFKRRG